VSIEQKNNTGDLSKWRFSWNNVANNRSEAGGHQAIGSGKRPSGDWAWRDKAVGYWIVWWEKY
jgi:hypothetical protein